MLTRRRQVPVRSEQSEGKLYSNSQELPQMVLETASAIQYTQACQVAVAGAACLWESSWNRFCLLGLES